MEAEFFILYGKWRRQALRDMRSATVQVCQCPPLTPPRVHLLPITPLHRVCRAHAWMPAHRNVRRDAVLAMCGWVRVPGRDAVLVVCRWVRVR